MALPEDHLAKFHKMANAKEMWEAIKSKFGGNDESKKMQKYLLKQQFEGFSVFASEGHKGYDRFQTLLSQLEIHGADVSHKDANQKFLRSLPSFWSQVALIMRTKPGLDTLSFDDLYNNLRVFKRDVKGTTSSSSSNTQNVAFVSADNTSSTNDVSTAYSVSSPSVSKSHKEGSSSYTDEINDDDMEEMDLKWQVAMNSMRIKKFHKRTGRKDYRAKENQDSRRRDARGAHPYYQCLTTGGKTFPEYRDNIQVNACDNHSSSELAKLTHVGNQQTSAVTTAMMAMLKQFQSNPPPAQLKAVEEICVTCRGAHPYYQCLTTGGKTFKEYRDNIQGFAQPNVQNNQNRFGQPQGFNRGLNFNHEQPYQATQSNQNFHLIELEKIKRMNDVSLKAMQNQIDMVKNELRNEMKTSIQTSLSNQTNEIKNMMANLLQMNTASTLGSGILPSNTIANPKGKLKAITSHSGLVTDGPTIPNPPKSVNLEDDGCVEETYTDPDHQEKDDIQIQKFWNMFKQLHLNITLAEALVLMPKYQKMLKALLSNKEKLQELVNIPLNKNCSAVILKKLPEKLGDPGKFLILCGFSELKCKALADLGASINLMPLSVWKKLVLPDLILTRMTLELANRAISTPDGIARDVFVPVSKFTFLADFVVVDYESDPRVPIILRRPFLRINRALINVHGEEMILRDGDERLNLNMKHDTASYSNHPYRESVNFINIFNLSRMYFLSEELSDIDSFNDIHPHFDDDPLSGSTTFLANSLLEEFVNELALITYPLDYDDNRVCDIESDIREIEFFLFQGKDSDFEDSIDQSVLTHCDDLFVDPTLEMFTDEQPPDYSFP
nr:hypothetical protein [Tanacetum cinerariifolium]